MKIKTCYISIVTLVLSLLTTSIALAQLPNLIPFSSKGKWGLQDSSGKKIVPAICDSAFIDSNGDVVLYKNNSFALWTKDGTQLFEFGKYNSGADFNRKHDNKLLPTHQAWAKHINGQWVILDRSGQVRIPEGDLIDTYTFHDGFSVVRTPTGMGLVNSLGEEIIPCIFDSLSVNFSEGRLAVCKENSWALFDTSGVQRSEFEYLHIGYANELRIPFQAKNKKWGYLDTAGRVAIQPQYKYVSDFSEGLAFCMQGDTIGYIDPSGYLLVPFQHFKYGGRFHEQRTFVGNDKRYGIIDDRGNLIIWSSKYVTIENYSQGFAPVRYAENRLMGYLDWMGKPVILGKFDKTYGFKEYLGRVELDGKFGFVNRAGEFVVLPQYDDASDFSHGLSRVKRAGQVFYIDKQGKEYIFD